MTRRFQILLSLFLSPSSQSMEKQDPGFPPAHEGQKFIERLCAGTDIDLLTSHFSSGQSGLPEGAVIYDEIYEDSNVVDKWENKIRVDFPSCTLNSGECVREGHPLTRERVQEIKQGESFVSREFSLFTLGVRECTVITIHNAVKGAIAMMHIPPWYEAKIRPPSQII